MLVEPDDAPRYGHGGSPRTGHPDIGECASAVCGRNPDSVGGEPGQPSYGFVQPGAVNSRRVFLVWAMFRRIATTGSGMLSKPRLCDGIPY